MNTKTLGKYLVMGGLALGGIGSYGATILPEEEVTPEYRRLQEIETEGRIAMHNLEKKLTFTQNVEEGLGLKEELSRVQQHLDEYETLLSTTPVAEERERHQKVNWTALGCGGAVGLGVNLMIIGAVYSRRKKPKSTLED